MSNIYQPFTGRVAIITGSSRGIGRAIAELLASRGADLVIADYQFELAKKTASEIAEQSGQKVIAVEVDVSNFEMAQEMAKKVVDEFSKVDILVNNAGITRDDLLMRMKESDWDDVININLKGAWNCSKAILRPMMRKRYGRIGLTKAMAREVASRGIAVNAVAPGFIPTALTNDLPNELKDYILNATPMGRMGTPEEIAFAVAFLASDESTFITGQMIVIDGGNTIQEYKGPSDLYY